MQIADDQTSEPALAALGYEAVQLLCSGEIAALAARFGYALASDRQPVSAIQEDLASCLVQLQATGLAGSQKPLVTVIFFEPNASSLFASIECVAPTIHGQGVLVELVVTYTGTRKHVVLEQPSAAV